MSLVSNVKITETRANFDITVQKDEYLALVDKYQNQFLKAVKVDGFRPGNVPKEIALKQVNPQALEGQVMEEIVRTTSVTAFEDINKQLLEANRVILSIAYDQEKEKAIREDDSQNLVYSCIAYLLPKVDLDAIESTKVKIEADETEFPKYPEYETSQIRNLMKDLNEYINSEEGAKEEDKVEMSFSGELDGVSSPELNSDHYTLLLGSNEFLPDFEKAIYGMKREESKTFDVQFPAEYFSDKFAGKTVKFTAIIKEVYTPKFTTVQEVIDSSEDKKKDLESEDNVRAFIKTKYDQEVAQYNTGKSQAAVVDALVYKTPDFEIAADVISQQTDKIFNQLIDYSSKSQQPIGKAFLAMGLRSEKKNIENLDSLAVRQEVEINVKSELKLQYIYLTVAKTKKLDLPSPEELEVYASQIAASPKMYGYPDNLSKEDLTDMIGDNLANRKALDYLIEKMTK
jgi:trigger factor